MTSVAVIGLQYGDEGKGKIVDRLAEDADYVVRYNGGGNAGHTISVKDRETILHLIPSGILREKQCIIGQGCVLDLEKLEQEIHTLENSGIPVRNLLHISKNVHITLPRDRGAALGEKSTGRGIAPTYSRKALRTGFRGWDLDPDALNKGMGTRELEKDERDYLMKFIKFSPFFEGDVRETLLEARARGENILFEGAQGFGLDNDFGQYPDVTSSNVGVAGIFSGAGVPPGFVDKVVGVAKAYTTRVCIDDKGTIGGPMVAVFDAPWQGIIGREGKEFGATTGRQRICGPFDIPLANHAIKCNGVNYIVLNKLDVLDVMDCDIPICTSYNLDGKEIEYYPDDSYTLSRCTPNYTSVRAWDYSTKGETEFYDLHDDAQTYVETLESKLKMPIEIVGTGKNRSDMAVRNNVIDEIWNS